MAFGVNCSDNWWSEALHGVARNGLATVFPITMGMASTFDDEAIERVYVAVSDEGRAKFHDAHRRNRYGYGNEGLTFWNPNVNIFRDPRWGRGQETFGKEAVDNLDVGTEESHVLLSFLYRLLGTGPHK